jgi:polysaccharide biosynthesis transport protein
MSIGQILAILWARKFTLIVMFLTVVGVAALITYLLPKSYTSTAALVVDLKITDPLTGLSTPSFQTMSAYMATQVDVISSRRVSLKVVDALKLASNPQARLQFEEATKGKGNLREWLADLVATRLDIKPSRDSSILELSYQGTEPEFSAVLANAFADAYIQTNAEIRSEPGRQNSAFFESENKLMRENLERAQAKLSAFQREHGVVVTDERLDVENSRLAELSTQLVLAQSQTYERQSRERQAKASDTESIPEIVNNAFVQGLKSELARQEGKLSELSERFGQNHPQYTSTEAEIGSLRKKIVSEIEKVTSSIGNSKLASQKQEEELKTAFEKQKSKLMELKKIRDDSALLSREVDSAQRVYENMMLRFNQTRLEGRSQFANVILLTPATPPVSPSSPKVLRNMLLATLIGAVLGLAFAFLHELLDRRIRTAGDLTDNLKCNVLGSTTRVGRRATGRKPFPKFWRRANIDFASWRREPA